jgi:hypothetical protein
MADFPILSALGTSDNSAVKVRYELGGVPKRGLGRNHLPNGKGVLREKESEGIRRQSSGLMNKNRIEGL